MSMEKALERRWPPVSANEHSKPVGKKAPKSRIGRMGARVKGSARKVTGYAG